MQVALLFSGQTIAENAKAEDIPTTAFFNHSFCPYLQLASFLCYDSVERKNEDDGGDPGQGRWAEVLKEKRNSLSLKVWISAAASLELPVHSATYLPQEEETESDFYGGQPDCVKVYHEIHQLLSVCGDQVDNFAHRARPSRRTVDDQGLQAKKQKRQKIFNSTLHTFP